MTPQNMNFQKIIKIFLVNTKQYANGLGRVET
jgi:hypothetical protein